MNDSDPSLKLPHKATLEEQRAYGRHIAMNALLHECAPEPTAWWNGFRVSLALAASIVFIGSLWLWGLPLLERDVPTPPVVAVETLEIKAVSGQVFITRPDGTTLSDLANAHFEPNDTLKTSANSEIALSLVDGSSLKVAENTTLTNRNVSGTKSFQLEAGSIFVEASKQEDGESLSIQTKNGIAKVVGTQFSVKEENDRTILEVKEGRVRFDKRNSGKYMYVDEKHIAGFGAEGYQFLTENTTVQPQIVKFVLIDAETAQPIPGFDPIPDNAKIPLSLYDDSPFTVLIKTEGKIRKASFKRSDRGKAIIENLYPYTINGDRIHQNEKAFPMSPKPGRMRIEATIFGFDDEAIESRTLMLTFVE